MAAAAVLGGAYGAGVVRLRRAGRRWPAARTGAFVVLGLGTIVVATMSSLAVYDRVLFWPAAVQNILLDLLAPLGLALGDPLGLAAGDGALHRALTSLPARVLTFPLVSSLVVLVSELTIYFTPYFTASLHHDAVRRLMQAQLLVTGCLFVLPMLTGRDLLPRWCTHPVRAALVFLDGLFDSVPGIVVMTSGTSVAGRWYAAQGRTWGPGVQQDQRLGGGLMLSLAELVALPFLIAVFAEWWRADRARSRDLDARLDRELAPAAPAGGGVPGPGPDLVRPWWETEDGEVGRRMRDGR
ncbi:cytochrome c oxidase assembly protein [Streptomyces liangshanensis]|uniref:cytochrome c oxidase assembly protein n=1 Tax=Streptomyces liangshanensis TaxID=2717324 RepID=UPI0036DD68FA